MPGYKRSTVVFIGGFLILSLCMLTCKAQNMETIGCYKDEINDRVLTGWNIKNGTVNMTLELCQNLCTLNSQSTYFGTQVGYECFCGDYPSARRQVLTSDCNVPCKGNQSQYCGGSFRISVYSVCPKGYFGTNCSSRCHCKAGVVCRREDGLCPNEECELGWTGKNCSIDVDECSNSSSIRHGCNHYCNNTMGSYLCSCREGYMLKSDNKACEDINECASNATNECTQNCTNTEGSYNCSCFNGYELNGRFQCEDVDECYPGISGCEQICENTPKGSYTCSCKPGFNVSSSNVKKCEDVNECSVNNGGCEQHCNNTEGAYKCYCKETFVLQENGLNCTEPILPKPKGSWRWIVLGVLLGVGLIIAVALVICVCRRCGKGKPADTKSKFSGPLEMIREATSKLKKRKPSNIQSDDVTAVTGSDVILVENDDVRVPTYENFSPPVAYIRNTRMKIDDLPQIVEKIRSSPHTLEKEFKNLQDKSDQSCSFAEHKDLKAKNKYKNILPYNHNRVTLSQIGDNKNSTYINASFMNGYQDKKKYIASHGPQMSTIEDFWRMVWEYKVTVIVMLTNCNENGKRKCEQYWPTDSAKTTAYKNGLSVKLATATESIDHITRTLILSDRSEKREVTQIQYTAWPDHGVPPYSIPLLSLRHKVKALTSSYSNDLDNQSNRNSVISNGSISGNNRNPIVIHCSAGCGRTGTYIGLDNLLDEAEDKREFDIHDTVRSLRNQRMNSVQTLDQYAFIHKALYEGLIFGVTRLSAQDVSQKIPNLNKTHSVTGQSTLETEFNLLNKMQPPYTDGQCSEALNSKNASKNRDPKLVPSNFHRVFYTSEANASKRYINAVMIPSDKKSDAYIATQIPLQNTLEDFWRMCLDYDCRTIICLAIKNVDRDEDLAELLAVDWLTCGKISVGDFHIKQKQQNKSGDVFDKCAVYSITVRDEEKADSKSSDQTAIYENAQGCKAGVEVTIVFASLSSDQSELSDVILNVYKSATSQIEENKEQAPVVVISRNGVDHCGPYIATSKCLSMLQSDGTTDVIQSVLDLKTAQPHFISTLKEYELIYRTLDLYCSQTAMYVNSAISNR